jgi:hypothetical protein
MQFSTVALALFASVAVADITTYVTSVQTITACPSTVTNCPASATSTITTSFPVVISTGTVHQTVGVTVTCKSLLGTSTR